MSRDVRPQSHSESIGPPPGAARLYLGYFTEVGPDDFRFSTVRTEATHGLIDADGTGDLRIVPMNETNSTAGLISSDRDTFTAYGQWQTLG
ncbi:hypothetical protein [Longimicrobium sp.]|jgi:hypothetical protein|uniref:hypothetical protein n=1 Tax=Longimicrobium sp. TaxID=2029185 RepID=UPI002F95773F